MRGIHRSPVNSPHKGQWRGALVFSLICARINDWVNKREYGDLRRYRVHYDVIVIKITSFKMTLKPALKIAQNLGASGVHQPVILWKLWKVLGWQFLNSKLYGGMWGLHWSLHLHYNDVIMSATASQITSLMVVYSTVYSGADQRLDSTQRKASEICLRPPLDIYFHTFSR